MSGPVLIKVAFKKIVFYVHTQDILLKNILKHFWVQ